MRLNASSLVDNGEIELEVDREGEPEVDSCLQVYSVYRFYCEDLQYLLFCDFSIYCVGLHDSLFRFT